MARAGRVSIAVACLGMGMALAACQTAPTAPAPAPGPEAVYTPPPGAREYRVDQATTLLTIQVYKGGSMAKMGHNHVIASRNLSGSVWLTANPLDTRFDIRLPVNDLRVDEPELRERAGADFPREVPQNAREGTYKNMLSAALLDGANYPEIRLRALDVLTAGEGFDVGVEITIKGQPHVVRVPMTVQHTPDSVVATGELALRQTELGLTPFSVMLGALVVQDEIRIHFSVTAR
jgi:polyisoprenoid-binding protein YceI